MSAMTKFSPTLPCGVCGGHPRLPSGQGIRCTGFETDDGYIHCTRENHAGLLIDRATNANPPTYAHIAKGECMCGSIHAPDLQVVAPPTVGRRYAWQIRTAQSKNVGTHHRTDMSDGTKRYRWEWEGAKVNPNELIYRIEVVERMPRNAPVVVTEGEKAADAIAGLDLKNTAVVGLVNGAPNCPSDDILAALKDRRVFLWPDNDDQGREMMRRTAKALKRVGAKEVRIITWGELPKDDGADFVARGGDADEFTRLAKAAALPDPDVLVGSSWASVKPETVRFLWNPYIPRGKVTLLEGHPGIGKSFICLAIATAVSLGQGLPAQIEMQPGNVLFLSAEDGVADTLVPRIIPMGADLSRIFSIDQPVQFSGEGLETLREHLAERRPDLVIFDPLFAFMGAKVDINRANETREIMWRLSSLAIEFDCAILGLRHLTKGGGTENRGLGSIDIAAAVRSILLAGVDPTDSHNRALIHDKSNLAANGPSLGYTLSSEGFRWTMGESTLTKSVILGGSGPNADATIEAKAWLLAYLKHGPQPAKSTIAASAKDGIDRDALRRAVSTAGVRHFQNPVGIWSYALLDATSGGFDTIPSAKDQRSQEEIPI